MSAVQYVGLLGVSFVWLVLSAEFMFHSAYFGAKSGAWLFAASFGAACLVASYCLVQLLRRFA